ARNRFAGIRSEINEPVPGSTSESADQSCALDATWFPGRWKLDGRRNSVAGEDSTGETNSEINRTRSTTTFSRDQIRCPSLVRNARQRFFRSAPKLAHSSKIEAPRHLPKTSHATSPRNRHRP